jgi:hypothetical protein
VSFLRLPVTSELLTPLNKYILKLDRFAQAKLFSYSYAALFTILIFANLFSGGINNP